VPKSKKLSEVKFMFGTMSDVLPERGASEQAVRRGESAAEVFGSLPEAESLNELLNTLLEAGEDDQLRSIYLLVETCLMATSS
jgi:hypothetical protein